MAKSKVYRNFLISLFCFFIFVQPNQRTFAESALLKVDDVKNVLKPYAKFFKEAYDLRDPDSNNWSFLNVISNLEDRAEFKNYFFTFVGTDESREFASSLAGFRPVVIAYREDSSIKVFGAPSYSYAYANASFPTDPEYIPLNLADSANIWSQANTQIVESNIKELLLGLTAIELEFAETYEARVKEAIAKHRFVLNRTAEEMERYLVKYNRIIEEFKRGLYQWDDSAAKNLGGQINPIIIDALRSSLQSANLEQRRKIISTLAQIQQQGIRFDSTIETGGNTSGPGEVTNTGSAGVLSFSGLYQQLVRGAYLYMVLKASDVPKDWGMTSRNKSNAAESINQINLKLAELIADFNLNFLDEIQSEPRKPWLEISLFAWNNKPEEPIEILYIEPINSEQQGQMIVGGSFRVVGEIPKEVSPEITRNIKSILGQSDEKEYIFDLLKTEKKTEEGVPIYQSKPFEIAPDLSSLAAGGLIRYPDQIPEAPSTEDRKKLNEWMNLYLKDMISILFRYIDNLRTSRQAIRGNNIPRKIELSTTIALYIAKLKSLTSDLVYRQSILRGIILINQPAEEEGEIIPDPNPGRGERVQEQELLNAKALHFNVELLETNERLIWDREIAWKEYFKNFDQVIEASQKTVLYYMKWLWIDIPDFFTGGRVAAAINEVLGASEAAQEQIVARWKKRIRIIPPLPPELDLGPGLKTYPNHKYPPRFLAIPRLRPVDEPIDVKALFPGMAVPVGLAPQDFPELVELIKAIAEKLPELDWRKGWEIAFKSQEKVNELYDALEIVRDVFDPEAKKLSFQEFAQKGTNPNLPFRADQRSAATAAFREKYKLPRQSKGGTDIDHIISYEVSRTLFGDKINPNFEENFWPLESGVNRGDKSAAEKEWIETIILEKLELGFDEDDSLPPIRAAEYYKQIQEDVFERFMARGGSGTLPREVSIGKLRGILYDEFMRWLEDN